jgi:hypothetical protein
MFAAEPAVFAHFEPVGIVLLVLHRVIVALFALRASQSYFYSHNGTSRKSEIFGLPLKESKIA